MEISNFKIDGGTYYCIFDGSHYIINNSFYGDFAISTKIERDETTPKKVSINFVIPNGLDFARIAIKKHIKKQETQFVKKAVNVTFEHETPAYDENNNYCGGLIALHKQYVKLNIIREE